MKEADPHRSQGGLPMAIKIPPLSMDDQEYYPLHEEDDVPETTDHESTVRYARDAFTARFSGYFVTGNVCIYWERGNTRDYRAPDLFLVKEPLIEPVTRVYQLWKQPPVAFVLEVGSRTTFRMDVGPKVKLYAEKVKAKEYYHFDLDRHVQRLWQLERGGYVERAPEANGRLRSLELELEFGLGAEGLRIYTLAGEMLLTHEETAERLEDATERLEEATQQAANEAQRRERAEQLAREAEARTASEAARRIELERQLAELQAQRTDRE
jgi:Uma2 family endonuclease